MKENNSDIVFVQNLSNSISCSFDERIDRIFSSGCVSESVVLFAVIFIDYYYFAYVFFVVFVFL